MPIVWFVPIVWLVPVIVVIAIPVVTAIIWSVPIVAVCIPIVYIHPIIIVWDIKIVVVGSRIDVDNIAVVVDEPIVYATIILELPIEFAVEQSAGRLETDDTG